MDPADLTEEQVEVLLHLEKQCVEHGCTIGVFDSKLRGERFDQLDEWSKAGFVRFGKITWATVPDLSSMYWIELSDEAWATVHAIRRARALKTLAERNWVKVDELDVPETYADKEVALRRFNEPRLRRLW